MSFDKERSLEDQLKTNPFNFQCKPQYFYEVLISIHREVNKKPNHCKAFVNFLSKSDSVGLDISSKYTLDGTFTEKSNGSMFYTVLLPLLDTVYYKHKDTTIISYGPKCSGKTHLTGMKEDFPRYRNFLGEALNYFYAKTEKSTSNSQPLYFSFFLYNREIYVSCFEIFMNEITDLLQSTLKDKKDAEICSISAPDLPTATKILQAALKKRKQRYNGMYYESQSHAFINIAVSRLSFNSFGEPIVMSTGLTQQDAKGVFTLIDLVGDQPFIRSAENSLENSISASNHSEATVHTNAFLHRISQQNTKSLAIFKITILSLLEDEKIEEKELVQETLPYIIKQNLKTDYKIYFLLNLNNSSTDKKLEEYLGFSKSFKENVGEYLHKMEGKREQGSPQVSHLSNLLDELKNEEAKQDSIEEAKRVPSEIAYLVNFPDEPSNSIFTDKEKPVVRSIKNNANYFKCDLSSIANSPSNLAKEQSLCADGIPLLAKQLFDESLMVVKKSFHTFAKKTFKVLFLPEIIQQQVQKTTSCTFCKSTERASRVTPVGPFNKVPFIRNVLIPIECFNSEKKEKAKSRKIVPIQDKSRNNIQKIVLPELSKALQGSKGQATNVQIVYLLINSSTFFQSIRICCKFEESVKQQQCKQINHVLLQCIKLQQGRIHLDQLIVNLGSKIA
eukprot:TRINITY_DN22_c4_g1_i1.p1 TRINITY_DN22_c4_g1~~TRINITY_DN22_c4_g1_i1.p1  ORF type:complete len:708 (+),score=36.45 TRINITY_DN22_c4_g1_i1:106-2124(+)